MLDDTLGPALVATLGPGDWAPTTDLHVQFLTPARPGRLIGSGRVVRRGRAAAFGLSWRRLLALRLDLGAAAP
jgi:acyl-coenzyme A thioesterase PaaI-like protein